MQVVPYLLYDLCPYLLNILKHDTLLILTIYAPCVSLGSSRKQVLNSLGKRLGVRTSDASRPYLCVGFVGPL